MTTDERAEQTATEFHQVLLEALRQREQDVIRYVAILAPALGGYVWLVKENVTPDTFQLGSIGVIFLLLVGSAYTLALGYNYRYITFQLAKIECRLNMKKYILESWPRNSKDFGKRYGGWLLPPDIIKVFYFAFLSSIALVSITAPIFYCESCWVVVTGSFSLIVGFSLPWYFGHKIRKSANEEPDWSS